MARITPEPISTDSIKELYALLDSLPEFISTESAQKIVEFFELKMASQ